MRKLIKEHEEKKQKSTVEEPTESAVPTYLLDRQQQTIGKALSSAIKQKRKEKAVSAKGHLINPFELIKIIGKISSSIAKSESCERCRSIQSGSDRQNTTKRLEANGNKSDICWRDLYAKTSKIRAIHPPNGASF